MEYKKWILPDPFPKAKGDGKLKVSVNGSNDLYGACSIEDFPPNINDLDLTHDDVNGFLEYPTSFQGRSANFWFKDSGVKVWAYEEMYDNWKDTYGMDAVMTFYHSGHGGMDQNGVFQMPLGGDWDNRSRAYSNKMAFSNEELRYLFWSTCLSLRIYDGNSPIRTWNSPNKGGLRMLFGFETTSIDSGDYGRFFWQEWICGKSFSKSFLDASWRISHNQIPVVMASGSNQQDAIARLYNERFFTKAPAPKGWYQWRWMEASRSRAMVYSNKIPESKDSLVLNRNMFDDTRLSGIAKKAGITNSLANKIHFDNSGNKSIFSKICQIRRNSEGALNIYFGGPNVNNPELIPEKDAVKIATKVISDFDFKKGIDLNLGNIRYLWTCGGSESGTGRIENPVALETIVQFRQKANGIESVNSDHGLLTVTVDNDGKVTDIYNSTRQILDTVKIPIQGIKAPPEKSKSEIKSVEDEFDIKVRSFMQSKSDSKQKTDGNVKTLTEKVGYDFSGNAAILVKQKDVEIGAPDGFAKRYKIRVPLL